MSEDAQPCEPLKRISGPQRDDVGWTAWPIVDKLSFLVSDTSSSNTSKKTSAALLHIYHIHL